VKREITLRTYELTIERLACYVWAGLRSAVNQQ
jgi:hypothetical protein